MGKRKARKQARKNKKQTKFSKQEIKTMKAIAKRLEKIQTKEKQEKFGHRVLKKTKCPKCKKLYIMYQAGIETDCITCDLYKKPSCLNKLQLIILCQKCNREG